MILSDILIGLKHPYCNTAKQSMILINFQCEFQGYKSEHLKIILAFVDTLHSLRIREECPCISTSHAHWNCRLGLKLRELEQPSIHPRCIPGHNGP